MKLSSEKYPNIEYTPGDEIFLGKGEAGQPFWFDVEEALTADEDAMEKVALMLDRVDELETAAKKFLKETLADEESENCPCWRRHKNGRKSLSLLPVWHWRYG